MSDFYMLTCNELFIESLWYALNTQEYKIIKITFSEVIVIEIVIEISYQLNEAVKVWTNESKKRTLTYKIIVFM